MSRTRTLPAPLAPSRFAVGARVGPYRLRRPLGRGSFGEVWLAERDSAVASNLLAVKLPLRETIDADAVRGEAEVWARAGGHPNVLPLFEANVYDGQVVIVSEYAPDGTLKDWLADSGGQAPSHEAAAELGMAVLAGLEHLHVRGIVHRDLKPANVLMQGGCPRIADFGLAGTLGTGATVGPAAGTPEYMAPEAFAGGRSAQTDLWAAGVMLHRLLGGGAPFPAGDLGRLMRAVASDPPAPLPESVPAALRAVVAVALRREPRDRFGSAADMRAALRDALRRAETPVAPSPAPRPPVVRTVAVTGSTRADPARLSGRARTLLAPYLGEYTTWYCGTVGAADEGAAALLLDLRQRVIAVGYSERDLAPRMAALLARHGAPFVNAQAELVPKVPGAPSRRDVFFASKADMVVLFWDGQSEGTAELLDWLRRQGKDHLVGFV